MKHLNEQTTEMARLIHEASKRKGVQWTRVTWYSWTLAIILFAVVIPAIAFYLGVQFQLTRDEIHLNTH